MRRLMNRLAIISLLGVTLAVGAALPAGASPTEIHLSISGIDSAVSSKIPRSDIVGSRNKAVFKPSSLKAKEDTSGNNCSTGFTSFSIDNTGSKTAYLTFSSGATLSLPAGDGVGICISGGSAGEQVVIGLSNSADTKQYAAKLTVTEKD